jgi:CheY-like chemotaxis protein
MGSPPTAHAITAGSSRQRCRSGTLRPGGTHEQSRAELSEHEAWRTIPVVVVTAKDLTNDERMALKSRTEQVIQKGAFGREQLLAEVRRQVRASVSSTSGT